jgi:hypothetical protein
VADIDGQGDPAVVTARDLLAGHQIAEAGDIDAAGVQAVVEGAVTPSVLGGQGQFDQGGDRAFPAQDRVGQLEEPVRARGEGLVELVAEPGQVPQRGDRAGIVRTDH